jgi:hypothetical protein
MTKYILTAICYCLAILTIHAQQFQKLENENVRAVFDVNKGALVQFENKTTKWKIIPREQNGRSFEMSIKLENGQMTSADGNNQPKPEVKVTPNSLTFIWNTIKTNQSGSQPVEIKFTGTFKLTEKGLEYSGEVVNHSKCILEQLSWPFIGEFSTPEGTDKLLFQYMSYTKFNTVELYPNVSSSYTGWCNLPEAAFALFHNGQQGLYVSSKDVNLDEYIRCMYEIVPDDNYGKIAGAVLSKKDNDERKNMRLQIRANRSVYTQPMASTSLVPVMVQPYTGTWHNGADIYKEWRKTWYVTPHRPEWIKKVNAWQQLQINSSEDFLAFKYNDIVNYAKECKKYGVDAIQLTGWHLGGQDQGVPGHDVDPRLGTYNELKNAIAESQKMGVNILLFTKFTWIDLTSGLYEKTYKNYIARNVFDEPCLHPGYNYYTYTQLLGVNTHRFGVLCLEGSDCRKALCEEFQKCLDLGAAGMVYDENQHHAGHMLCFDKSHGHRIPGFLYRGADLLGHDFMEMTKKSNPDFVMTGEGPYDLQSKYYVTYTRADVNHFPVLRYIDSELPIACAVTDHYDKNRVNMCLKNKYAISYEPRSFKGHLWEFPRIMEYGQKVDQLRKKYADRLWYAEYKDVLGASVSGKDITYSVLERNGDHKKAIVVLNTNTSVAASATIKIDQPSKPLVYVSPENPEPVGFSGEITLQPQSVIVVWEK